MNALPHPAWSCSGTAINPAARLSSPERARSPTGFPAPKPKARGPKNSVRYHSIRYRDKELRNRQRLKLSIPGQFFFRSKMFFKFSAIAKVRGLGRPFAEQLAGLIVEMS